MYRRILSRTLGAAMVLAACFALSSCFLANLFLGSGTSEAPSTNSTPGTDTGSGTGSGSESSTITQVSTVITAVRAYQGKVLMAGTYGGAACYWVNSEKTMLQEATGYTPTDICSDGSNIYVVAGTSDRLTPGLGGSVWAYYWKNGAKNALAMPSAVYSDYDAARASAVCYDVDTATVYFAGSFRYSESGTKTIIASCWSLNSSTEGSGGSVAPLVSATYTQTSGNSGYQGSYSTVYWANPTSMTVKHQTVKNNSGASGDVAMIYIAGDVQYVRDTYYPQIAELWVYQDGIGYGNDAACCLMPNTHDTSGAAWQNTAGSIAVDSHNTVWVAGSSGGFPCYWSADCNGSDAVDATAHTNAISALSPAASIMTNNSGSVIGGGATAIMLNSAGTGLGCIFGYAQPVSADSSVVRPFFYTYTSGSTEGVTFCTVPDGCTLDTAPSNGGLMFNDGSTYTLNGTMLTSAVFGIVNLNKSGIIVPCFWLLGTESSGHPID